MASEVNYSIELGKRALENRDFITATQIFSNAIIEENNSKPDYWCCLAESLFYQAQFESALQCWHEAASVDPNNKEIWIRI
ncbi:MAG: tetratricopeptide repeat protein, partial [Candidatus Heimdallarchaeota archaeon]